MARDVRDYWEEKKEQNIAQLINSLKTNVKQAANGGQWSIPPTDPFLRIKIIERVMQRREGDKK